MCTYRSGAQFMSAHTKAVLAYFSAHNKAALWYGSDPGVPQIKSAQLTPTFTATFGQRSAVVYSQFARTIRNADTGRDDAAIYRHLTSHLSEIFGG